VLKVKYWLYSWERSKQTEWKTEKLAVELGKEQTDRVENRNTGCRVGKGANRPSGKQKNSE
jgi:hypothetical protein